MHDENRSLPTPLDAFLATFWKDVEDAAVRPLADYLAKFPGDDAAIEQEYRAAMKRMSLSSPRVVGESSADRISHYRLLHEIGRGGQGIVYAAEDTRLHRKVALKVLKGIASLSEDSLARFRREAEAASRLDHPGICAVYEAALDGKIPYIAMRLVEGESLAAKIASAKSQDDASADTTCVHLAAAGTTPAPPARPGTVPSPTPSGPTTRAEIMRVVQLVEKVARALHAAHEAGVVHRDMKPGNVMITPEGEAVVMDFGLAHLEDEQLPTLTQTGEFFGTPAYMSPEQLLAQRVRLDRRTDVWSLGVMLYECVTLARPFDAPTREGVYQAIQTKEPLDPRRINHSMPVDLRVVIATALEKDRDRRYQTALDFAEELRRIRCFEPIQAKPAGPILRFRRWAQRNPVLATAIVVYAVLSVGIAITTVVLGKTISDYDRLGDYSRLERLIDEATTLWPGRPEETAPLQAWVDRATALEGRLSQHEFVLEKLRRKGTFVPDAIARSIPESRPTAGSGAWRFESERDQFKHDTTARLAMSLRQFVNPDPARGLVAAMRWRLDVAKDTDMSGRWPAATHSIADETECPKYNGLKIIPQKGMIPIGKDPGSGLWEFVHVQTAHPGIDPIPARGRDGRLAVTEATGIVLVLLPGGVFRMGAVKPDKTHPVGAPNVDPEADQNEVPVTEVTLDPYFMSKYEMTQGQWLRTSGRNPSESLRGGQESGKLNLCLPVAIVSWDDCDEWLPRLGLMLPTEAQWEYGARGGTTTPRWTGSGTDGLEGADHVMFIGGSRPDSRRFRSTANPIPVGGLRANPFGLHDVLGNLSEWCRDAAGVYTLPVASGDGLRISNIDSANCGRVVRGGCYGRAASDARSAVRGFEVPEARGSFLGVRPSRRLDP